MVNRKQQWGLTICYIPLLAGGFDNPELSTDKLVKFYLLFHSTFVTSYLSS